MSFTRTFAPELDLYRLHTLRVTQSDDSWGALAVVCDVRCRLFVAFVCDVRCSLFAFQREGRRRMVGSLSFSQSSQECTASAAFTKVDATSFTKVDALAALTANVGYTS